MFKMLKKAHAAGYSDKSDDQHGGEVIHPKGHTLVCDAERAVSRTEWRRRGFCVRPAQEPHAVVGGRVGGKYRQWEVYRDDQVEAVARRASKRSPAGPGSLGSGTPS